MGESDVEKGIGGKVVQQEDEEEHLRVSIADSRTTPGTVSLKNEGSQQQSTSSGSRYETEPSTVEGTRVAGSSGEEKELPSRPQSSSSEGVNVMAGTYSPL